MSKDDEDKPSAEPKFLRAEESQPSRREVLQFLSAVGVAGVGVGVATHSTDADAAWAVIPYGEIIEMALTDPAYKAALLAHPKQTLAEEHGVVLGAAVTLIVVEDSMELVHVVMCTKAGMRGPEVGVVAEILEEFRTDAAFRQALLDDPREVFAEWTGGQIPDQLDVEVVVETPSKRVIQLPAPETMGAETIPEVQALWGGGGDWGDWPPAELPPTASSQVGCSCWTPIDYNSNVAQCCLPDTEPPDPF